MQSQKKLLLEKINLLKIDLIKEAILYLGFLIIKVVGDSMLPTIHEGEKIIVEYVPSIEEININDIVFFYDQQYVLALHRLIRKDNEILILLGDNCETEDIITFNNILGKVVYRGNKNQFHKQKEWFREIDNYRVVLRIDEFELISIKLFPKGVNDARIIHR